MRISKVQVHVQFCYTFRFYWYTFYKTCFCLFPHRQTSISKYFFCFTVFRCSTLLLCVTVSLHVSFTHKSCCCVSPYLLITAIVLVDWPSHLAGWSVCWGRCVVSLQVCRRGGGGREVSLLGSSCLLISGEQMEESPHLAGDQFYPRNSGGGSSSTLGLFIS